MNDSRSFASLTPTLLARKGSARPAMRPQFQTIQQFDEAGASPDDDDLGFNDMGLDEAGNEFIAPKHQAEVVELKTAVAEHPVAQPEVRRLQEKLAGRIGKGAGRNATGQGKARQSARSQGRNVAFTLRLDTDRHLELRLASALAGRSAQQLLTEALDKMINDLPDVAALATRAGKRN